MWVNLLCCASANDPRGTLPSVEDLAYVLQTRPCKIRESIKQLIERGLLADRSGTIHVHNWDERQFESDSSTKRVQQYRARMKRFSSVTETANVTGQDTDTDTDTDTEQNRPRTEDETVMGEQFKKFYEAYPKHTEIEEARREWEQLNPDNELVNTIMEAIELQKYSQKWTADGGRWIPSPAKWLANRRWLDEVDPRDLAGKTILGKYYEYHRDYPL